jgi:hypothetical protein
MQAPRATAPAAPSAPRGPGDRRAAAFLCFLVALVGALGVSLEPTLAYDEAMHAALPAQRMAVALRAGELEQAADALLDCDRYPFVYPAVLAAVQFVLGPSDLVMRRVGRVVWAAACFGLFLLTSETALRRAPRRGKVVAPWLALILALTSPLAVSYSGTLFLEVPFVCAMVFALWAWLLRDGSARAEHRAGALFTLAFFTKFNYGVLLGLVLALDLLLDGLRAFSRGAWRPFAARCLHLCAIPAAAGALWFGLLRGAEHRRAFLDFLAENRDPSMAVGIAQRWIDWSTYFALSPLVLGLVVLGWLADLAPSMAVARRPARVAALTALVFTAAVSWHGFHLDRFLLPGGMGLWCVAGLGLARLAPEGRSTRVALGLLLAAGIYVSTPIANQLNVQLAGLWPPDEQNREYVRGMLRARRSLSFSKPLPVAGLGRGELERLLDLISAEVAPAERVAWLGIPSELSRGVLHAGLLSRSKRRDRFLADAPVPLLLETEQADPGLAAADLVAWAEGYDVLLFTEPVDLRDRPGRRFIANYVARLRSDPAWNARLLGQLPIQGPGGPIDVALFALRRRQE